MENKYFYQCFYIKKRHSVLLMKIILLLFCTTAFSLNPVKSFSQNEITINSDKKVSVDEVFELFKTKTSFRFIYQSDMFDGFPSIYLEKGTYEVRELLENIFKGSGISFTFFREQVILINNKKGKKELKISEQQHIHGTVTSEKGMPLIGATVLIKGTKKGVITNFDGEYNIQVSNSDAVLVFSYVGYETKEIPVDGRGNIDVVLTKKLGELDEVILIGYGETKKDKFTGAVSSIDTEVLQTTQNLSFADALIGIVPGMLVKESFTSPDAPPTILLRGIGSINSSTGPLFVVDGVQMPSGLGQVMVNANDIKEISILKDAAATSIYGSRGSNGVILISTKRGKKGEKMQVQVNSSISRAIADQSFVSDLMNSQQKLNYEESLGIYSGREEVLAERRASGNDVTWADLLLQNGKSTSHYVSISGGSEKVNYYSSLSYNGETNQFGSVYNRTIATVKMDYDLLNNLSLGFSGRYGQRRLDARRTSISPFQNSFLLNPWEQVYEEDGSPTQLLEEGISAPPYNPLFKAANMDGGSKRKNIMGNIYLEYSPLEWLKLKGTWGGNFNTSNSSNFEKIILGGGELRIANAHSDNYTANFTATIDKNLNNHHINLLLGHEVREAESSNFSATARGFLNNNVRMITAALNSPTIYDGKTHSGSISYFTRLDYSFDNIYNLSGSFRRDGSSRFGDNNQFANFWSLGASLNAKKILFEDSDMLNKLRFRASIGTSGNDFIGNFDALSLYGFRLSYDGQNVPSLTRGANPDLTWEKNRSINIGLDFGLLQNRISGSINYYDRETRDLINNRQISFTSGFSSLISNIGKFRNRGIEVSLKTINITSDNFNWTSTLNFSHNSGKVLKLTEDADLISYGNIAYKEGAVINALYIADWVGVNNETGLNQYLDADGNIIEYDTQSSANNAGQIATLRTVHDKTSVPTYFGGFINNFQYKNFELRFLISFAGGHYLINSAIHELYNKPYQNQHVDVLNAWKAPGDETNIAIRALNKESDYGGSTQFLQDGDYMKLKNLTLGYNFNHDLLKKFGINALKIFVQGQNLFTITEVDYIDPEYSTLNGGIGISSSLVRKFSLGINLAF